MFSDVSTAELWHLNTFAVKSHRRRQAVRTGAELMRRTDTSPAAIARSNAACEARRRDLGSGREH